MAISKDAVHALATALGFIMGITIGALAVLYHEFDVYVMLVLLADVAGSAAHLMTLDVSKSGIKIQDLQEKKP